MDEYDFVYDESFSYQPDLRTDRCYWCKRDLHSNLIAGYDKGLNLPVCSKCIYLARTMLDPKSYNRYFYTREQRKIYAKKEQLEFDL